MKKSWAQVATALPGGFQLGSSSQGQRGGNPVRSQLDQVASMVCESAKAVLGPDDQSGAETRHSTSSGSAENSGSSPQGSKAWITPQIKSLEAALAHLPDNQLFADQRQSLITKIDSLKNEISETQPIGARIDSKRAALQRAQNRQAEATRAAELAQEVVKAADAEVNEIATELEALESALAKAPNVSSPSSFLGKAPMESVDALQQHLGGVLEQLRADPRIDPGLMSLAETHSEQLLQGFRATFAAATQSQQSGEAPQPVKVRARTKRSPAPSHVVHAGRLVRRRFMGKTPASSRTLGAFFIKPADANASSSLLGGDQAQMDSATV